MSCQTSCIHGDCQSASECLCYPNWFGDDCDRYFEYNTLGNHIWIYLRVAIYCILMILTIWRLGVLIIPPSMAAYRTGGGFGINPSLPLMQQGVVSQILCLAAVVVALMGAMACVLVRNSFSRATITETIWQLVYLTGAIEAAIFAIRRLLMVQQSVHVPTRRLIWLADRVNIAFIILSAIRGVAHLIFRSINNRALINLIGNILFGILLLSILAAAARSYHQLGALLKATPLSSPSHATLSKTVTLMAGITAEAVLLVLVSIVALLDPGNNPYWGAWVYGIRDIGIIIGFSQLLYLMGRRQREVGTVAPAPPPIHSSLASSPGHTMVKDNNLLSPVGKIATAGGSMLGPLSPGVRPVQGFGPLRASAQRATTAEGDEAGGNSGVGHHLVVHHSTAPLTQASSPVPVPSLPLPTLR